jgi:hypothetical protein
MKIDFEGNRPFLVTFVFVTFLVAIYLSGPQSPAFLWDEDGLVEVTSAFAYILAICACMAGIARSGGLARAYFTLWAVLCVVFLGEESSWLQHWIGYQTPEAIARLNEQREFNIHNLKWFHGGVLLEGTSTRRGLGSLLSSQNLFRLGFVSYFLLLPAALSSGWGKRLNETLRVPYPGKKLLIFIWVPIAVSALLSVLSIGEVKAQVAEARETYYAISILAFVALMLHGSRSRRR